MVASRALLQALNPTSGITLFSWSLRYCD